MKKIYVIASLALTVSAFAQKSYSCTQRQYCYWIEETKKYGNCDEAYDDNSLFVINKDETMFTHTTQDMKSTYYVGSKEYDAPSELTILSVTSDVGNKYFYIFDAKNKQIRVVINKEGKTSILLSFTVKAIF